MKNLIKKIMEEAEEKSKTIIEEAKNFLNSEWEKEKNKIDREYEEKEKRLKKVIDSEISNDIVNFRIEKNKEILSLKNELIERCEEEIENKFNEYLNKNMGKIISSLLSKVDDKKELKISIPENADVKIDGYDIVKDKKIKDKFLIQEEKWDIEFSWDIIKKVFGERLRKEIAEKLFNEQEK